MLIRFIKKCFSWIPFVKNKKNVEVEIVTGEVVNTPRHFHVDKNVSKKKRGRPSKKSKRSR
jgi:hypothetical protein|tara:strand:- start:1506 stop:1688 length:183 start_codon:yes stop_codon:yes gene_type:complete